MHPTLTTRQQSAAKFFLLALLVTALDQLVKWAVHTYMQLGGEVSLIGQWVKLSYTLNEGMAFGAELPAPYGKLVLTAFRLVAVFGLSYYILRLCRQRAAGGYIACMALILGGAVGNLVDSVFYGIVYDNAPFGSPTRWFYGQVIDMIYVPVYRGYLPKFIPIIGGEYSTGFPVFNIADSSIFIGVALVLLNQGRFFNHKENAVTANPGPETETPAVL